MAQRVKCPWGPLLQQLVFEVSNIDHNIMAEARSRGGAQLILPDGQKYRCA
jgi:hypothetical protein